MLTGQPGQAVQSYEEAVRRKPELARDAEFTTKLTRARCQAAFRQGQQLGRQQRWDEAIVQFQASLELDSGFAKATDALADAKRRASKQHHERALRLADEGKLNAAIREVRRALELDPENLDATDALNSIEQKKDARRSQARGIYLRAVTLVGEKRWQQAGTQLNEALSLNRNHLLCRVERHRAVKALADARRLGTEGTKLLTAKRLDDAQAKFRKALAIWPFYEDASLKLQQAVALRRQAEDLYQQALGQANQKKWEEAVETVAASLQIFPFHPQARVLLADARQQAALARCRNGDKLLADGDLLGAEREFNKALYYVAQMPRARQGLASVDATRAADAQARGFWGHALLWYLEAADHVGRKAYAGPIATARTQIVRRATFVAAVEAAGGGADQRTLRAGTLGYLSRAKPDVMQLVAARPAVGVPGYRAVVNLMRLNIRTDVERTDQAVHRYTVVRDVPNPEIPRLHEEMRCAIAEVHRMEQNAFRPCPHCGTDGKICCDKCDGKKRVTCSKCDGKGKTRRDGRWVICSKCHAKRKLTCSKCSGKGTLVCPHCNGTQRIRKIKESDIRRMKGRIRHIRHQLHRAPMMVPHEFPAEWPYVIQHVVKHGSAEARLSVVRLADGAAVLADRARESVDYRDTTIPAPNSAIGLRGDPLHLPSDDQVRDTLIDRLGPKAGGKLLSALVTARGRDLMSMAEDLASKGRAAEAVEVKVDYAHTIERQDAARARRLLADLRAALRANPPAVREARTP